MREVTIVDKKDQGVVASVRGATKDDVILHNDYEAVFSEEADPVINEDELVGFVMRKVFEKHDINLTYEEVSAVLEAEMDFLDSKGLIGEADTAER